MTGGTEALHAGVGEGGRPVGQLALSFQEAFTVTVRLRRGERVAADAETFRGQIKRILSTADRNARDAGYDGREVRLAVYAFVAFLDESILNSRQSMFSDWPRRPLQEEVFGDHRAGETFFENLRELLGRGDSRDLADLLEVYLLCLLLGFRGRFGSGESGELRSLVSQTREKIDRIRGEPGALSPSWEPPADEQVPDAKDPWARGLAWIAGGAAGLALVLFLLYFLLLGSGLGEVRTLAEGIVG